MKAISRMKFGETVEQLLAVAADFGWRSALSAATKAPSLKAALAAAVNKFWLPHQNPGSAAGFGWRSALALRQKRPALKRL
jgi:hypothetical protein